MACPTCSQTPDSHQSPLQEAGLTFDTLECRELYRRRKLNGIIFGNGGGAANCPICSQAMSKSDSPTFAPDGTRVCTQHCRVIYTQRNIHKIKYGQT